MQIVGSRLFSKTSKIDMLTILLTLFVEVCAFVVRIIKFSIM